MLMPSALPCDPSQTAPLTRLQSALFASPPPSPPQLSTQTAVGSLFTTCRSLQSLLASPPPLPNPGAGPEPITPPTSSHTQLPTPPMPHTLPPPLKLRLRPRRPDSATAGSADHAPARRRIVKRAAAVAPPRGLNKRRRAADDDPSRHGHSSDGDDSNSDIDIDIDIDIDHHSLDNPFNPRPQDKETPPQPQQDNTPHTPPRARIAPEVIPLGLGRADFHGLGVLQDPFSSFSSVSTSTSSPSSPFNPNPNPNPTQPPQQPQPPPPPPATADVVLERDGSAWTTEDDRMLVELVLEKLRLSKADWHDCARSLGRDRGSLGRRWKSLMGNGDVGLRRGADRRARVYGSWR
ncbi:hypothetical protein BT67DRAFT_458712 [Trichocladium antarcticum]|uniref:Myb-like domain-containing protein n=1 Tax=Trichocladium antarcticum TaxID=1450529 RepID=A0AAN6UCY9_9PEZI|nr:hypothetical protein BT67DRAFT_458712 [Trichocladium antarcticum]